MFTWISLISCKFSHDLEAYLATKPPDIGDRCVQFELFGEYVNGLFFVLSRAVFSKTRYRCRYGYKCRYLKAHLDQDNKLVVNEEVCVHISLELSGVIADFDTLHSSRTKIQCTQSTASDRKRKNHCSNLR